jgi:hypothetical protein
MRNAVSNKGESRKILGGKNLTVARATFATVWIRAWTDMYNSQKTQKNFPKGFLKWPKKDKF